MFRADYQPDREQGSRPHPGGTHADIDATQPERIQADNIDAAQGKARSRAKRANRCPDGTRPLNHVHGAKPVWLVAH